jgi:tetratricopeptide (TPR) repeat protein
MRAMLRTALPVRRFVMSKSMSSNRRATVSLCMIVRNEAHQLAECLTPVADLFDEIVIVDTGSLDETRHVARRFTEQVHDFVWCDDFAAARNESLRHASGEWIFWLDADDRVDSENRIKLAAILNQLDNQPAVFFMDTLCRAAQPNETERLVTHARLFPRHPEVKWRRRIHEQLGPWSESLGFQKVHGGVQIDHLGYCDRRLVQRKQQRNLRLLEMEFAIHPDDHEVLLELAVAHARRGRNAQARRLFNHLIEMAPPSFLDLPRVLIALSELAAQEGDFRQVLEVTTRGLVLLPHDDYLAYLQGEALYQLGEYAAARMALTHLLNSPPPPRVFQVGSPSNIRERLAPLGLGEVLRVERRLDEAEAMLRQVAERFPSDPAVWQFLGRVYIDGRQRQKLDEVIERLSACPRGEFFAAMLTASWSIAHGDFASAESILDRLISESPGMPLLRLMRAECLARAGVSTEQQLRAYRDLLRLEPGHPRAISMVLRLEDRQPRVAVTALAPLVNSVVAGHGVPSGVMSA